MPRLPAPRQPDFEKTGAAKGFEKEVEDGTVDSELEKLESGELVGAESVEPLVEGEAGDVGEASQERKKEEDRVLEEGAERESSKSIVQAQRAGLAWSSEHQCPW